MLRPLHLVALLLGPAVSGVAGADTLNCHAVELGDDGKLVSWLQPQDTSMGRAATAAAKFFTSDVPRMDAPVGSGGRPAYFFWPELRTPEPCGAGNLTAMAPGPSNPTGMYAMIADALTLYHTYSGDRSVLALIPPLFDYVLANGTTPVLPHWAWPGVPYASSTSGDLYFSGADDADYYNRIGSGDGPGAIEPDKLGEFGVQLLTIYKLKLGGANYRDAAVHFADVLCKNMRDPSGLTPRQSPWPFRVHAQTNVVREEYTASTLGPIKLLDELIRLGLGNVAIYRQARAKAWEWMMNGPMTTMLWCGYFEDIVSYGAFNGKWGQGAVLPVAQRGNWHEVMVLPRSSKRTTGRNGPQTLREPVPAFMRQYVKPNATAGYSTWETCNYNQYSPLETARYLMSAPDIDPQWREHAEHLVEFVRWALIDNPLPEAPSHPGVNREGDQWGARAVSEQAADVDRMVSHTSRYASVLAQLAERTANHSLGAIARRSWDWSSYMSDARGRVVVGPVDQSMWFSDGYGDFIRNTMHTMVRACFFPSCIAVNLTAPACVVSGGQRVLGATRPVPHPALELRRHKRDVLGQYDPV
jgi:hypothetical protein